VEGHTANAIGNFLFIVGGFDSFGVTDAIVRVDLRNMEAEVLKDVKLKQKRENHTAKVLNGDTLVIAGGWNGH